MKAVKAVFSNGEHDEREEGPFNQGVVLRQDFRLGMMVMVDIASSQPIAHHTENGWSVSVSDAGEFYSETFLQAVSE